MINLRNRSFADLERRTSMQKNIVVILTAFTLILGGGSAIAEPKPGHMGGHQQVTETSVESKHADVKKFQACAHCGMDRGKFSYSRMLITYADGLSVGVCSIHCTATELKASKGKAVKSVEVADLNTTRLVYAEKATWVTGGSKKGVMSKVPKWAFSKKTGAEEFIKKNGGNLANYIEVLALAEKD